jgi:8-oxo-dGTP pyrophosphatase MutT (NUDIX family)
MRASRADYPRVPNRLRFTRPIPRCGARALRCNEMNRPPAWIAEALAVDYSALLPLRVAERRFGWVAPEFAAVLQRFPEVFVCEPERVALVENLGTHRARTDAVAAALTALRAEGLITGWRDEQYEVYAEASGEPLFRIERAAVKRLGIRGRAAHLNGIVQTDRGWAMWIARRADTKPSDPGKLDNLVGGGVAAGLDFWQTLIKECREEAGIPFFVAEGARLRDTLAFDYLVPEGLDSNEVEVFDLLLPSGFVPRNEDGEVAGFELLPFDEVRERLQMPHLFTVDAAVVAWSCLQRWERGTDG